MSPPTKYILGFFARFVIIYGLLIAPVPGLRENYAKFYRAGGTFLFSTFGSKGITVFEPNPQPGISDTVIKLQNREQIRPDGMILSLPIYVKSRYSGYLGTAFLIALILATPVPILRRLISLLAGLILIHCYIAFNVGIAILYSYNLEKGLDMFDLSPFWERILNLIYQRLEGDGATTACGLVVSVFIWMLVSFRHQYWAKFFRQQDMQETEVNGDTS